MDILQKKTLAENNVDQKLPFKLDKETARKHAKSAASRIRQGLALGIDPYEEYRQEYRKEMNAILRSIQVLINNQ